MEGIIMPGVGPENVNICQFAFLPAVKACGGEKTDVKSKVQKGGKILCMNAMENILPLLLGPGGGGIFKQGKRFGDIEIGIVLRCIQIGRVGTQEEEFRLFFAIEINVVLCLKPCIPQK
jgi:hypothetical protein